MDHKFEKIVSESSGFTSDSRSLSVDEVFVALKGERVDGHDFIEKLLSLEKGPRYIICEKGFSVKKNIKDERLIEVDSVHESHRLLANLFRKKFNTKIVAVGGSNGKTSTKDFLFTLLSMKFRCIKTEKSQNGELGIPKTLEKLKKETEVAIVEVGIDRPGDMQRHVDLLLPDIACLTSIGEEHLNLFKNVETVFQEEKILFDHSLARGKICFAPLQDHYLKQYQSRPGVHLIDTTKSSKFDLKLNNKMAEQNARLALAIAEFIGLEQNTLKNACEQLKIPEGRGEVIQMGPSFYVVNDTYNANPDSMKQSFKNAFDLALSHKLDLLFMLGDMFDLGEQTEVAHQKVASEIKKYNLKQLVLIGPEMSKLKNLFPDQSRVYTYQSTDEACQHKNDFWPSEGVVLMKASRGMSLEKILKT